LANFSEVDACADVFPDVDKNNAEELLHGILTSGSPIFSHGIFKKKLYIKCQIYST
jgi:hypothetical protein